MPGNVYPFSLDQSFLSKTTNFPDTVYTFYPTDNLYALMNTLLGDAGAGQLRKLQNTANNTQDLNGIEFFDLDQTVGALTNVTRMPSETYNNSINPFIDQLTRTTWDDINFSDSAYRERLSLMLSAINSGATVLGITLLAEAALGSSVRVIESWKSKYAGGSYYYPASGAPVQYNTNTGVPVSSQFQSSSPNEFLIVPLGEITASQETINALMQMVELLKPANSIATFYSPTYTYNNVVITSGSNTVQFTNGYAPRPGDLYAVVTGTGIPSGTYISAIGNYSQANNVAATITLSNNATANATSLTVSPINREVGFSTKQIIADSEWFEYDMYASTSLNISSNNKETSQYSSRYWLSNSTTNLAPLFAHGSTVEEEIPANNLVTSVSIITYSSKSSTTPVAGSTSIPKSVSIGSTPSNVTSTIYGAQ
jgi:hypothetical protein